MKSAVDVQYRPFCVFITLSLQLEVFIVLCQVFSVIEARSQELEKIRDGQLKATKKSRSTATTKRDAFENYIKMFYDLRKIEVSSVHYFCVLNRAIWYAVNVVRRPMSTMTTLV